MGFRLLLGLRVWGSGFRVQGLGFKAWGLGLRVWHSEFRGSGSSLLLRNTCPTPGSSMFREDGEGLRPRALNGNPVDRSV